MMTQELIFRPVVAEKLGTHRLTDPVMGALILEQLNLWHVSGNGFFDTDGNFWLNPSVSDWEQAAGASFSPWKVRAIVGKFEQLGYVIREKFCKLCDRLINSPENLRADNHTKLIRLNWERLAGLWKSVEAICNDGSDQTSESDSDSFSLRSDKSESDLKTLEILKSESEAEPKKLEILKAEFEASTPPPLPESPEEEQTQLMAEVRNATGKL
ncbi:MAG: hypothetical protein ICV54_29320, partial [Nostoc sp. C3-bin3]|nr:hypothetical protein [Nostoc sp. C3-bin3]